MFSDPLFYVVLAAVLVTAGILAVGISSFGRGGPNHGQRANRIMLARNVSQLVTVALIMFYIWMRG